MRYLILIEYRGSRYGGWQRQLNALTVQEVLEEKISIFLKEKISLTASGRTDAGVHALGQAAHFDTESAFESDRFLKSVNSMLPDDIAVLSIREVPADFHARYTAKRKTYEYKLYVSPFIKPLKNGFAARVSPPVNVELMRYVADFLIGEHDFTAFSSAGGSAKSGVRTIYSLDIEENGEDIIIRVDGNGFLYNMVRIIVGTLVEVGKGKIPPENVIHMLETGNRALGGKTYPAEGLYLKSVYYDKSDY